MKLVNWVAWAGVALTLSLISTGASAHRMWLLPSSTVLSGDGVWVTVDAAIANELFYFDHHALRLDGLSVADPEGKRVAPENLGEGQYRSTFDVPLRQQGTYAIAVTNNGVFASYRLDGERKRWRGSADQLDTAIPAGATDVRISEGSGRVETFVTLGAPTKDSIKPSGVGLEVIFETHPNDLFSGETASFRLVMSGEPAPGVEVSIIPGGNRYRDQLGEIKTVTDAEGKFEVTWPSAGMFWIGADLRDDKTTVPGASRRQASYAATLEVLPQ